MVTKKERLAQLSEVRLFEGLSGNDLRHIVDVSGLVHHDAGDVIINEGDKGVGFELILGAPIRLVEIDPSNGAVLRSMDIRDESGTVIDVGVAGSLVWNAATGKFLASSIRGYVGVGKALFDLSLDGVASNPRALTGGGDQGMGFRSEPVCGG